MAVSGLIRGVTQRRRQKVLQSRGGHHNLPKFGRLRGSVAGKCLQVRICSRAVLAEQLVLLVVTDARVFAHLFVVLL